MERENDCDTNCNRYARKNPQRLGKRTGRLGNKRTSGDHPDISIIKIGLNTEKSQTVLFFLCFMVYKLLRLAIRLHMSLLVTDDNV